MGKRNIEWAMGEKMRCQERRHLGIGLGPEWLPEHEAHGGGQHGVEQAAERAAGGRAAGWFTTIFHC